MSAIPVLTDTQRAIVEDNAPLVEYFLHKWRIPAHEHDDALQDGLVGLMRAAQLYDPTRGFTFSTYAQSWIRAGVQKGRGRAEGINYRRATGFAGTRPVTGYQAPISIDQDLTADGWTLSDLLVAPDDPAAQVTDVLHNRQTARLAIDMLCHDELDRDILTAVATGTPTLKQLATNVAVSETTILRRLNVMRTRARHPAMRRRLGLPNTKDTAA